MTHAQIRKIESADLAYFMKTPDMLELGMVGGSLAAILGADDSYTITINDHPVALAGFFLLWAGVGEGWAIVDKAAACQYPRAIIAIRDLITLMETKHQLRRFQAAVAESSYENLRFARWCGFQPEARLAQHYPNGSNTIIFSRVR